MNPDLTNLQLISLGIAIAIATTFTTVLISHSYMQRRSVDTYNDWDSSKEGESQELTSETAPFPAHYVVPRFGATTTDNPHGFGIHSPNNHHPFHSQANGHDSEYLLRRILLESGEPPNPKLYLGASPTTPLPDTRTYRPRHLGVAHTGCPGSRTHGAMATHASPNNNPDYPAGSWNPGDRERALAQIEWDQPIPVLDSDNLQPEQIDASPPYFAREAIGHPQDSVWTSLAPIRRPCP